MKRKWFSLICLPCYLLGAPFADVPSLAADAPQEEKSASKTHIAYLMRTQELARSIDLYSEYREQRGKHDFELLQELGSIILEQGARGADPEIQLISLFGIGIAGLFSSPDILEPAIASPEPQIQIAAIQLLGQMQDDSADELLIKAMGSDHFFTRMESAYQLALRKHRKAVGQIEALMYKVPRPFWGFFPEFFASIGTSDAIGVLKQLIDDRELSARVEAILSAARHGRDDLLSTIRAHATHLNSAEQEACATALGSLKDSKSLKKLQTMAASPDDSVRLSAYRSLYLLGDLSSKEKIEAMAKAHNLFAIASLGAIPGSEDLLAALIKEEDMHVRTNACISLLKRRDARCLKTLSDILIRDSRDWGFQPYVSLGKSFMAWKVIPSLKQHGDHSPYDLISLSLSMREQMLKECLELKESDFLFVARRIFDSRQTELIPLLVRLLENSQTPSSLELLQEMAQRAGAPLVRAYCNLSCFRLHLQGHYEEALKKWVEQNKDSSMIRFRPMTPWTAQRSSFSSFELTPEESSLLLIESYQALADRHNSESIDALLRAIRDGNMKNRYVLAGLLIRAIQ
jgi:hypothetical protein